MKITEMRRSLPWLAVSVVLGGCMIGPDYQRPEVDAPKEFRFADANAIQDVANTAWWEQFQDPVLDELIKTALADNKDVKILAARVEEYYGLFETTRSQMLPQLGSGAGVSKNRATQNGGPTSVSGNADPHYNAYQAQLNLSWEIDLWGRVRRQTEAARADMLATEEARRGVILSLVSSVASSYVNLRDLDRQLEIAKNTVKTRGESLKVFELRFTGGVISAMELAQNRSEYEYAVSTIPQIEAQIAVQENALSILLGRNPGPILRGLDLSKLELPSVPAGLPSQLIERRPDLRQAEQNLIAANARIGAARAEYFPTISLTGLAGVASPELGNMWSGTSRTWAYGAGASLPIFTAGSIEGRVTQAEAGQKGALLQYQRAIQNGFREVDDALVTLQKSRQQLSALGRQVDALHTYARMARLRYDAGYTSYIEVLDAERSLFNAELSYTQTQGVTITTLIDLYKALGGGWVADAERMTEPTPLASSLQTVASATASDASPAAAPQKAASP